MHFCTFPRTEPPSPFVTSVMDTFRNHEKEIGTATLDKGLSSDGVMAILRTDLEALGFKLEADKTASGKLKRPVFFGETVDRRANMKSMDIIPNGGAGLKSRQEGLGWATQYTAT